MMIAVFAVSIGSYFRNEHGPVSFSDAFSEDMNIAFRLDASPVVGAGHFMRCLTLAIALKRRGAHKVLFLSRYLPNHLQALLTEQGFEAVALVSSELMDGEAPMHSDWLGTSQIADASECLLAMSGTCWDWIIVDHYALDQFWESAIRAGAKRVMVIDDLADRQHDCDVLLDQNAHSSTNKLYDDIVPGNCVTLLGPRYALLRDEFSLLREKTSARDGKVERINVFFGGMDAKNFTLPVIQALSKLDLAPQNVDVVIGAQHPALNAIIAFCSVHPQFECHVQTDRMAEILAAADLAIGAGGGAIWEKCSLGVPTLAIPTADNQICQVQDAASIGLVYGVEGDVHISDLVQVHVRALLQNYSLRKHLSENARHLVDGKGASRVAAILADASITVRRVTLDDSSQIFGWRNHSDVRATARDPDLIPWLDHMEWFSKLMASADSDMLLGENRDGPVGLVRFDIRGHEAEISIYLVPGKFGDGWGRSLLRACEQWLSENRPTVKIAVANVRGDNGNSRKFFEGLNYQLDSLRYIKRLN